MIRTIIGAVAVLAGFAVVEQSVDASTGRLAGSCTPTDAYALLPRGAAVPVRSEPTPQAVVIGTLSAHRTVAPGQGRLDVTVTGSQGGWARIALDKAPDYSAEGSTRSFGWIPADLLTVDARVDGAITVYSQPGWLGRVLATIEGDDMKFRVLGCRGDFLQVINARHGNVWIDRWCAREDGCRS
jgi:hypothetical protein